MSVEQITGSRTVQKLYKNVQKCTKMYKNVQKCMTIANVVFGVDQIPMSRGTRYTPKLLFWGA